MLRCLLTAAAVTGALCAAAAAQDGGPDRKAETNECQIQFRMLSARASDRWADFRFREQRVNNRQTCRLIKAYVEAQTIFVRFAVSKQEVCHLSANRVMRLLVSWDDAQKQMDDVCANTGL